MKKELTPREVFIAYYNRRRREGGPGIAEHEWQELVADLVHHGLTIGRSVAFIRKPQRAK